MKGIVEIKATINGKKIDFKMIEEDIHNPNTLNGLISLERFFHKVINAYNEESIKNNTHARRNEGSGECIS